MITLDPNARPTFDTLLHTSRGTIFPECFYSFLHNYVSSINDLPAASPFSPIISPNSAGSTTGAHSIAPSTPSTSSFKPNSTSGFSTGGPSAEASSGALPSDSDHRMDRIWADYESVEPYLVPDTNEETVMDIKVDYGLSGGSSRPYQVSFHFWFALSSTQTHPRLRIYYQSSYIYRTGNLSLEALFRSDLAQRPKVGRTSFIYYPDCSLHELDGPALIILSLVSANVRNCALPSSKVRALDVFLALSCHLTDEAKLDRMVPYIVDLLHDEAAIVRAAGLRTLMQVVSSQYH